MDIREEFEKLCGIAETIKNGIYYDEKSNSYWSAVGASYISLARINGAWYAFQEQQKKIDAHNKKLSLFIDELKKTHSDDKDNKMDYWRGFSDCAEASVKVFYRDVGFAVED